MNARRASALATSVVAWLMLALTPAWATDSNYPPGGTGGVDVGGVKSGNGSGLPHTGFDFAVLWVGLAVLLIGVVLLATTRHRSADAAS